ncbi:Hypothetical protein R9X50_00739400 [Acrodontium crateriforme]|uniref:ATPase synthesis protein 25 n=1 Tax=Acrodontium crateriforme TaxID=150365 RepID=A0AAQ3MBS6_9PEZI|nr:Hypothetical protein R9X50_00739400 [Acrodontium crateriforme]
MSFSANAWRSLVAPCCRQWTRTPLVPLRTFATPSKRMNEARERIQKDEPILTELNENAFSTPENLSQSSESSISKEEIPSTTTVPHIPWYLQPSQSTISPKEESADAQFHPLQARQKLPDLPSHPPAILKPLLEQVSVSLGMDDLTLLDLRTLDPPPALGANLLMLIGTARSEKHLHVSADRLCRWLRSNYDLTPFADGLLGRNELKLKMRRKAKRSRLLSSVGSKTTADSAIDDGIRTGWVCVNVGKVEGGELPENVAKDQRQEGFVGFGGRSEGCRIVVQMLTEEKRGEVDLERLWTGILKRAQKQTDVKADLIDGQEQVLDEKAEIEHEANAVQR